MDRNMIPPSTITPRKRPPVPENYRKPPTDKDDGWPRVQLSMAPVIYINSNNRGESSGYKRTAPSSVRRSDPGTSSATSSGNSEGADDDEDGPKEVWYLPTWAIEYAHQLKIVRKNDVLIPRDRCGVLQLHENNRFVDPKRYAHCTVITSMNPDDAFDPRPWPPPPAKVSKYDLSELKEGLEQPNEQADKQLSAEELIDEAKFDKSPGEPKSPNSDQD